VWHSCAKVREPIELPSGVMSGLRPVTGVLDEGPHPPREGEVLRVFDEDLLVRDFPLAAGIETYLLHVKNFDKFSVWPIQ